MAGRVGRAGQVGLGRGVAARGLPTRDARAGSRGWDETNQPAWRQARPEVVALEAEVSRLVTREAEASRPEMVVAETETT